ncbi:hypothetical protein K435DRAFT_798808 [Dendrothele bispora CBS 962.96]|uniref:CCHC-type domain-containing protein n=1 Tax=Dendrothele bispora (strain CBS 962.96) TaxID=1314807 RepID=A0A4S8LYG5_DENBC|nr:hypothetical protein K435DRAFT_798808 [Dendrothele bispora CBS 962.96]
MSQEPLLRRPLRLSNKKTGVESTRAEMQKLESETMKTCQISRRGSQLSLKQSSEKEWRNRMEEQNSAWQRQLQQMSWQMHPYQAPTLATPVGYSQSYVPQSVPQVVSTQYAQQRPGGGAPALPQPQFNAENQRLPSANDNCFFCGVKGHVLANCLELSMYISKGLCQMQGKFVKTVRGDTPPGAGEPGVTLKERLDRFNAANNIQGVAVTVQSVDVAYTRDSYEMEELREALREKEREAAQYRQAQVSSQFMNGAVAYQPFPDHPGMRSMTGPSKKPLEDDPDIQSKEKVGSKPPAKALDGRADKREESDGVEKKNPNKYKSPQKKFGGVELEPTVNGRRVPAALFQRVEDVTSMAKPGPAAQPAFAGGVKEKEGKTVRLEPLSWNTNRYKTGGDDENLSSMKKWSKSYTPAYHTKAEIEDEAIVDQMVEKILSAEVGTMVNDLMAVSKSVREGVRRKLKMRRVSTKQHNILNRVFDLVEKALQLVVEEEKAEDSRAKVTPVKEATPMLKKESDGESGVENDVSEEDPTKLFFYLGAKPYNFVRI